MRDQCNLSLDSRDFSIEGILDIGACLRVSPLIKIGNRIVVGVSGVILSPVALEDTTRVLLIFITFRDIFHSQDMCK